MNLRITYIRLLLCFCSVLTFSLLGCSGDSYPGLVYDDSHGSLYDMNSENSGQMPITVFLEKSIYLSGNGGGATRAGELGTGPWDEYYDTSGDRHSDPTWRNKRRGNTYFHIYAFREKAEANPPLNMSPDLTVTYANDEDNIHCLVDNTANEDNPTTDGLKVQLMDEEEGIQLFRTTKDNTREPMYWSYTHQQTGYTFSMYHTDDLGTFNVAPIRTQNQIYYDFKINGQHDIMFGKASRPRNYTELKDLLSTELTDEEEKNIVEYGFSTYAAHRNVNPKIIMNHCLTRLQFVAVPGDVTANYITVTGIDVISKVNARLLVASNDHDEELGLHWRDDELDSVSIGQWNADTTAVEKFKEFAFAPGDYDEDLTYDKQKRKNVGAPVMVSPMDAFDVVVHYKQLVPEYNEKGETIQEKDAEGNLLYEENGAPKIKYKERDLKTPYRVTPPADQPSFQAGYIYYVTLLIYGLAGIEVGVDVTPWKPGGDTGIIEPDYGFGAKPLPEVTPQEQWSDSTEALE